MGLIALVLAAVLLATQVRAATTKSPSEAPAAKPTLNAPTVHGCFSSSGSLTSMGNLVFNSIGGCAKDTCFKMGKKAGGTSNGAECFCGDSYPPLDTLVDDSKCDITCTGYPFEICGGLNYWTIYNTGVALGVPYDANGTAHGTSTTSSTPNSPTAPQSAPTVVVTALPPAGPSQSQSPASGGGSSLNVGGIAAGVVVGIALAAAIAGAILFFLRRRRNKEIEEEHRHNAAVNAFINGSKLPGSSGGVSHAISDSRLDPVMAQRRMSSGTIADNADYSRKILRVTNA